MIKLIENDKVNLKDETFLRDLVSCLESSGKTDRALCLANYVNLRDLVRQLARKQALDILNKNSSEISNYNIFLATEDKNLIQEAFNIEFRNWMNHGLQGILLLGKGLYSDSILQKRIQDEIFDNHFIQEKFPDNENRSFMLWEQLINASLQIQSENWITFAVNGFINSYPGYEGHSSWVHGSTHFADELWKIRKNEFLKKLFSLAFSHPLLIETDDVHRRLIASFIYRAQWNDNAFDFSIKESILKKFVLKNRSAYNRDLKRVWLSRVSKAPFQSEPDFLRWQLENTIWLRPPFDENDNPILDIFDEDKKPMLDFIRCIKISEQLDDHFKEKKYYALGKSTLKRILELGSEDLHENLVYYAARLVKLFEDEFLIRKFGNIINSSTFDHSTVYRVFLILNNNRLAFKQGILAILQDVSPSLFIDRLGICQN